MDFQIIEVLKRTNGSFPRFVFWRKDKRVGNLWQFPIVKWKRQQIWNSWKHRITHICCCMCTRTLTLLLLFHGPIIQSKSVWKYTTQTLLLLTLNSLGLSLEGAKEFIEWTVDASISLESLSHTRSREFTQNSYFSFYARNKWCVSLQLNLLTVFISSFPHLNPKSPLQKNTLMIPFWFGEKRIARRHVI